MPLIPRLNSLWRNLFHKDRVEQECTEEIQAYLDIGDRGENQTRTHASRGSA